MHIIGLCGSLRKESYNRKLLKEACRLAPEGMEIEFYEIHQLPLINEDLEEGGFPEEVKRLMTAVEKAEGLLLVSPEYNTSVSPVIKNAIDWLSRAPKNQILSGKPGALMGASTGYLGTTRMQLDLRKICSNLNMYLLNKPLFILPQCKEQFTPRGQLTEQKVQGKIVHLLEELQQWILRLEPRE